MDNVIHVHVDDCSYILTDVGGHFQVVDIQMDVKVIDRQRQHHTKNRYKCQ